jgi:RNA-directed DNA polymerase
MAQQKSDDCIVPMGRRKALSPRRGGDGKAVTVEEEEAQQPLLPFATAEVPRERAGAKSRGDLSPRKPAPTPKANDKQGNAVPATMESVVERLLPAFAKVAANKGAPGPDRQTIAWVRKHLPKILPIVSAELLEGTFRPGDIRRVYIPKGGGGQRGLGIPNVVDRMVQEAVRSVLEPLYEPTFHPNSHGFRPGRGCQTAISEAREHLAEGHEWVVDIDLEKFFDRVNHQRLMSRLAERVGDKRLLALIGRMLKAAVVMPEGVKVATDEGVPQGGPLSPLLSNVVLDELDQELSRRGHRFVRYADDCNIYVRSEKAGQRVMASVVSFISRRLRLKVNAAKSAVAHPETRHFLGYRLWKVPQGGIEVLLSERSVKRLREKIVELTPRNWGSSLDECIRQINAYSSGWMGHFGICTPGIERVVNGADGHIRRRLRAIQLRHWKSKRTIATRLVQRGAKRKTAWTRTYEGRKSWWALSHEPVVERALPKAFFLERGLRPLLQRFREIWADIAAPAQLQLPWATARS